MSSWSPMATGLSIGPRGDFEDGGLSGYSCFGDELAGVSGYSSLEVPLEQNGLEEARASQARFGNGKGPNAPVLQQEVQRASMPRIGRFCTPSPASTTAGLAPGSLELGATVRVQGLKSKPKLNGQEGILVECDSAGRWTVDLGGETAKLQAKFLEFRAPPSSAADAPAAEAPAPELLELSEARVEEGLAPDVSTDTVAEDAASEPRRGFGARLPEPASSARAVEVPLPGVYTDAAAEEAPSQRRRGFWANTERQPEPRGTVVVQEEPQVLSQRQPAASSWGVMQEEPPAPARRQPTGGSRASRQEQRLGDHLAALEALAEQEEAKRKGMLRQREKAVVVPGMPELLASLDNEEEAHVDTPQVPASGSRQPQRSRVPALEEVLAEIDGHERDETPSLELVLANIERDEEVDTSAFLMLGNGVEPEPERPTDPLAKMMRLTSAVKPLELLPTRSEVPESRDERKPEVAFKSRRAVWQPDDLRATAPAAPPMRPLGGEGPIFDRTTR